jgi:LPXTG-motif cell wall-anchored protein
MVVAAAATSILSLYGTPAFADARSDKTPGGSLGAPAALPGDSALHTLEGGPASASPKHSKMSTAPDLSPVKSRISGHDLSGTRAAAREFAPADGRQHGGHWRHGEAAGYGGYGDDDSGDGGVGDHWRHGEAAGNGGDGGHGDGGGGSIGVGDHWRHGEAAGYGGYGDDDGGYGSDGGYGDDDGGYGSDGGGYGSDGGYGDDDTPPTKPPTTPPTSPPVTSPPVTPPHGSSPPPPSVGVPPRKPPVSPPARPPALPETGAGEQVLAASGMAALLLTSGAILYRRGRAVSGR